MASSLNDIITAIAPTLPSALVAPAVMTKINAVAQQFPLTLGTTVGFECSLHTMQGEADFFFRTSGALGRSLLAGQHPNPPVLEQLRYDPEGLLLNYDPLLKESVWRRIQQLARYWSEPKTLLHRAIEDIWLEFDIDLPVDQQPLPSSFFGISSPGLPSLDWVRQIALPTLLGDRLSPIADDTLQRCFSSIPPTAKLFQVGVLSGRTASTQPPIRLYIQDLQIKHLSSILSRLDWPGDISLLTQVLIGTCGEGNFSLQLEIQDTLSPVIAVECCLSNLNNWKTVLDRLVATGFCNPERAAALLSYPGYVRAQDNIAPFPPAFENWSDQLAPYRECLLVKRLAYLKFTYQPGTPLLAKAYLGLSPTWIDPRYLHVELARSPCHQEEDAIRLCKALIRELDYSEIDIDPLFLEGRSQKSRCLNQALAKMCVGR